MSALSIVLEAAQVRVDQWAGKADGKSPFDLIDEVFEADADEARDIADDQQRAIRTVENQLPPQGLRFDLETLASNAMCLWEEMLERQRQHNRIDSERSEIYEWITQGEGAFAGRDGCWALAAMVDIAWDHANGGDCDLDGYAFDWEFIPIWLDEIHRLAEIDGTPPHEVTEGMAKRAGAETAARLLKG